MPNTRKCPHCLVTIHIKMDELTLLGVDPDHSWKRIKGQLCPNCGRYVIEMDYHDAEGTHTVLIYPKASARPVSPEVDSPYSVDFKEASLVLADSPKASAAISRRCLQAILREKAGITKRNLAEEIEEFINDAKTPKHIAESVDGVRQIGNFAAHPIKSTSSGEIVDVENGEAEWCLEVLELLFDFYFVQPKSIKSRRTALNAKLKTVGKPALKEPPSS